MAIRYTFPLNNICLIHANSSRRNRKYTDPIILMKLNRVELANRSIGGLYSLIMNTIY